MDWLYPVFLSHGSDSGAPDLDSTSAETVILQQIDMNAYLMKNRVTQDDPSVRQYKSKQFRYAVAQTMEKEEEQRDFAMDQRG